jgi:tetraacyldisaccharide 4'-kinase
MAYGCLAARRMERTGRDAGLPVICVGNFVAGGAGKTPLALLIGHKLLERGVKPAFLTRGFGGRLAGPLVVDRDTLSARDVGDEPMLLDAVATTIVSRDRYQGACLAQALGAAAIVMDDGLQNPALAKTLTLAAVDAASGIGNGRCLPAGPLRAPLARQLKRINALVLIGEGEAGEAVAATAMAHGKQVLRADLRPDAEAVGMLDGRRVLAFAGIGRPEKFFATLRETGAELVQTRSFGDHAPLTSAQVRDLLETARRDHLLLVTTAKDQARMTGRPDYAELADATAVVPVTLVMRAGDEARFGALLAAALAKRV